MASSSSKPKKSHDVFLSFRGPEVHDHFLGYLYEALVQAGIDTYMADEELKKGEQISLALMKAIEESHIAVVVFSNDYASSTWCLDEVTQIMECKKKGDLMVFPVFYKVDPREVRTPRDNQSYAQALAHHEVKFEKDPEKVKKWKKALYDAGSLSGFQFTDGYEPRFTQDIVQEISTQLWMVFDVAKYPVGLHSRVQKLKTILNLQSKGDVLMVGLWGLGGVGKTTLANAIYYSTISRDFQGASFLKCGRINSKNSTDLVLLQKGLLSQLLPRKKLTINSDEGGSWLISKRLCKKKVLIILDDVDNACQLNALVRHPKWFGKGSRIIITTRNKHLLISHGVHQDHIYEVEALKDGEDLELLTKHAFRGNQEIKISSNLVDQVLQYAKGLPLALEVLGAFLYDRGEHEWKSTLEKLDKIPHKEINEVLKVSYDGLDYYTREVFLDIACFFKGMSTVYIKKVLDSCDFATTIEIQILKERCLISEEEEKIQMHDLIQVMGMDIVKEGCRDDPEECSRLWLYDDVLDVLSRNMGTKAIKAIVLQLAKPKEMCIGFDAFTKMTKLRLLILHNVDNSFQGPIHLPNELKWFDWPNCGSTLEFSNGQKKLVGLHMQNSKIKVVPKQLADFNKLKFINFHNCQMLDCMPDLNCTPNLEELDLSDCKNLESAHESIAYHGSLQLLNLSGCSKLHHFPNVLQSKKLELLNLSFCSKLQRFPDIPNKIEGLRELYLLETSIEELPASIENLVSLEEMNFENCKKLAILPSTIYKLKNLLSLGLSGCSKLSKFPKKEEDTEMGFPKLWTLHLQGCNLSEVEFLDNPSCFPKLQSLHVSHCKQLKEILKLPEQLINLEAKSCESLSRIPSDISHIPYVRLNSCHELVSDGLTMNDLFNPEVTFSTKKKNAEDFDSRFRGEFLLPGGEMPQWLLPNEEGYISFTASKDLYEKFTALVVCVVCRREERIECFNLRLHAFVNGKQTEGGSMTSVTSSLLDHVCLRHYEIRKLWGGLKYAFGANDRSQFRLMIRAAGVGGIVKKCGFRLICKPLENDLKVFLEDDQLLDPALLYEIRNEDCHIWNRDCQTSIEEDGLFKSLHDEPMDDDQSMDDDELMDDDESMDDDELMDDDESMDVFTVEKCRYSLISPSIRHVRPGGEMPEEFVPVEDGTISFMVSQDFYDKFRGLVLCVVVGVEGGEKEISFDIVPHVHGQRRNALSGTLGSFDLDHVWIQYLKPDVLWGVLEGGVDFGQFNESYLRFSIELRVSGGTMKRLGYVLRCAPLDNALKVKLEGNQSVDPAVLYEDYDGHPGEIASEFVRRFTCIESRPKKKRKFTYIEGEKQEDSESETD